MRPIPIAFYAPLKPPDHPQASGDRTMARLLMSALRRAGFAPELASRLRTFEPAGDPARQAAIAAESRVEADRLEALYGGRGSENPTERSALSSPRLRGEDESRNDRGEGAVPDETLPSTPPHPVDASGVARPLPAGGARERPRLWFTYHCYYKAPDHLGPEMARRLGIPLVIAEASRAPKRAGGLWALAHEAAEAAITQADTLLVLTGQDRECLERALRPGQWLVELPPFVDVNPGSVRLPGRAGRAGPVRLLAVAMMRPGDKLASYRLLGEALSRIAHLDWVLDVVGGGSARPEVERVLAPLGSRVSFLGERDGASLASTYAASDLLVWPAFNEAYGMVLLEAQAHGCPVVAGGYGGVRDAMLAGKTGELTPPGDPAAFADAVAGLIADPGRRLAMGEAARIFVAGERSLDHAADILRRALAPLLPLSSAA